MGSKRPNSDDIRLHASFMNAITGRVHDIDVSEEVSFLLSRLNTLMLFPVLLSNFFITLVRDWTLSLMLDRC